MTEDRDEDFYVRYYVGHKGQWGHEFMEFELHPSGRLCYANQSKREAMIRREVFLSSAVVEEMKRIIWESRIVDFDDSQWKEPEDGSTVGRQELECKVGHYHIAFTTCEIVDIQKSLDPEGLAVFCKLIQDLKEFVRTLLSRPT